jgi:photosynthetic reaction center H subunit
MARKDRGARDAAGIGPHRRDGIRLASLSKLKWDVADGEPDIRGWEVKTLSGHEIGKVKDLLVDTEAGEVVMLDIDLEGSRDHTLAPIRAAQVDRSSRVVRIDSSDIEAGAMPSLTRDAISDDDARRFNERYGQAYGARGWDRDRDYIVERDGDEVLFTRRDRDADAEPRVDRTPDVVHPEPERRSVRYGRASETEEEVIERRPVVVEEVVVRRRVVDDSDTGSRRASGDIDGDGDRDLPKNPVREPRDTDRGRDLL